MMRTGHSLPVAAVLLLAGVCCAIMHPHLFWHWVSHLQWRVALAVLMFTAIFGATTAKAQTLKLGTVAGGITVGGANPTFTGAFGNMNALGAGTIPPGTTIAAMSNGALYYSQFSMKVSALGGTTRSAKVTGYVSTNTHTAALVGYGCPYPSACTASGSYSALSTSVAAPSTFITSLLQGSTVTVGVAFFLPDNDGASAYAGSSSVVITFTITNLTTLATKNVTLTLSTTVQTAVRLTLTTATGGATINPAADYSLNFGNVNALGIGPGAGLTTTAVAGGMIYHTPYLLNPAFSAFASTTSTIKVTLTSPFAHPTILIPEDSGVSGGPYTAITATATTITAAAADRASITRYLGLFVSNVNGATAFTGSDSATLTFTLTVP